jgi:hypothetical protein
MLDLVTVCFLRVPFEHRIMYILNWRWCARWPTSGEPVSGLVRSRSRRLLREKQGKASPRATERGRLAFHHAELSEKIPDPEGSPQNSL